MTPKNQVAIPAEFRAACQKRVLAAGFMLRKDAADHLNLYPMPEFHRIRGRLRAKLESMDDQDRAEALLREWSVRTAFLPVDQQGRVTLPREMLAAAGIKGPVLLFVGCDLRLEIWDAAARAESGLPEGEYGQWLEANRRGIVGL